MSKHMAKKETLMTSKFICYHTLLKCIYIFKICSKYIYIYIMYKI